MTYVTIDDFLALIYISPTPTPLGGGKAEKIFRVRKLEATMDNTLRRLKTIEGHLRGITRMVEEDA